MRGIRSGFPCKKSVPAPVKLPGMKRCYQAVGMAVIFFLLLNRTGSRFALCW
jgi:hypothetical protein